MPSTIHRRKSARFFPTIGPNVEKSERRCPPDHGDGLGCQARAAAERRPVAVKCSPAGRSTAVMAPPAWNADLRSARAARLRSARRGADLRDGSLSRCNRADGTLPDLCRLGRMAARRPRAFGPLCRPEVGVPSRRRHEGARPTRRAPFSQQLAGAPLPRVVGARGGVRALLVAPVRDPAGVRGGSAGMSRSGLSGRRVRRSLRASRSGAR